MQTESQPNEQAPRLPLYFVGLIPQGEVKKQIDNIRNQNSGRFGCRVALKSPPHITVLPPFRIEPENVEAMKSVVRSSFPSPNGLLVKFSDVGTFERRTIFLDVLNDHHLNAFDVKAKELVAAYPHYFQNARFHEVFHPHVTLANRDILPEYFDEMVSYLRNKIYPIMCDSLRLEILHLERGRWEIVQN